MNIQSNAYALLHSWAIISLSKNVTDFRWNPWNKPTHNVPIRKVFHHVSLPCFETTCLIWFRTTGDAKAVAGIPPLPPWGPVEDGGGAEDGVRPGELCRQQVSASHPRGGQCTPESGEEPGTGTGGSHPTCTRSFSASTPLLPSAVQGTGTRMVPPGLASGVWLQGDSCLSWGRTE